MPEMSKRLFVEEGDSKSSESKKSICCNSSSNSAGVSQGSKRQSGGAGTCERASKNCCGMDEGREDDAEEIGNGARDASKKLVSS